MSSYKLPLACAAIAVAAPALAATTIIAGPFDRPGQCNSWLPWKNGYERDDFRKLGTHGLVCRNIGGKYYLVQETEG